VQAIRANAIRAARRRAPTLPVSERLEGSVGCVVLGSRAGPPYVPLSLRGNGYGQQANEHRSRIEIDGQWTHAGGHRPELDLAAGLDLDRAEIRLQSLRDGFRRLDADGHLVIELNRCLLARVLDGALELPGIALGEELRVHLGIDDDDQSLVVSNGRTRPRRCLNLDLVGRERTIGAFVNYGSGPGNLLTASFPHSQTSWEARSKDHLIADPASITAYAIGIRHRNGIVHVLGHSQQATGAVAQHPTAHVTLDAGWILSGGGALDNYSGQGNLLTASYPNGRSWVAAGKDHIEASPASITTWVLGIKAA